MLAHSIRLIAFAIIGALGLSAAAMSQSTSLKPFPLGGSGTSVSSGGGTTGVKIAVTYQFFIEGKTASMGDQTKLADQGRKHLYLMLAKECVVLKETIAENCTLQRASVNAQLRKSRGRQNGVRVSGSASYRIDLKKDE